MSLHYYTKDSKFSLRNKRIFSKWIKSVISIHNFKCGEISYIFTDNANILEINQQYLQHNYFTDIITFNYNSSNILSGDIYISIDTVKSNAILYNVSFDNELHRVMIHGVLHLIGFNDKSTVQQKEMKQMENQYLNLLYSNFLLN